MTDTAVQTQKKVLRRLAHANRDDQQDKDDLSRRIVGAFLALPEYATAQTVMFYVDVRSEVRTRFDLPTALDSGKTIVVPWCNQEGELELFRLNHMDQLEIGMHNILEPKQELRGLAEHRRYVGQLDLIMVPGVGFDDRGARIGHGQGYYDRLLQQARPDTPLVALAFECQMFADIPVAEHDIFMDRIITEDRILNCNER